MSERKKRNTAAFMLAGGDKNSSPTPELKDEDRPVSGNYARQAYKAVQRQRDEAQTEAALANETFFEGVLAGTIPLRIPASQISDEVGTDRVAEFEHDPNDPAFIDLVQNIRDRGLRTPIRVRPVEAGWRPDARFPREISSTSFALQSGRRRLAACVQLGIEPLCFLSFVNADAAHLDDLNERFFENTVRKDLTTYEYLFSVGLISREIGGSQEQVAENIGVSQTVISRSMAVVTHADALANIINLKTATRNEIDTALKNIRAPLKSTDPQAVKKRQSRLAKTATDQTPLPFQKKGGTWGKAVLERGRGKQLKLSIESDLLTEDRLLKILAVLEQG